MLRTADKQELIFKAASEEDRKKWMLHFNTAINYRADRQRADEEHRNFITLNPHLAQNVSSDGMSLIHSWVSFSFSFFGFFLFCCLWFLSFSLVSFFVFLLSFVSFSLLLFFSYFSLLQPRGNDQATKTEVVTFIRTEKRKTQKI